MQVHRRRFWLGCWWVCGALLASVAGAQAVPPLEEPDEPPSLRRPIRVLYPMSMRMAGLEGQVKVEFVITPKGDVVNANVVASNNPWFERPALDAILRAKFNPGKKAGRPVYTLAQQAVTFRLNEGDGTTPWRVTRGDQTKLPPAAQWEVAPEPINSAFPVYPFDALVAGTSGKTRANFFVGPDGSVVQAKVLEATAPEFAQAVLAMVETWRFRPARKADGTPAFALLSFVHEFAPNGEGDVPVTAEAKAILRLLKRGGKGIAAEHELDAPPRAMSRRAAVYPLALRETGGAGRAEIEFFIDANGDVQLPRVLTATVPEFGYAAAQAVATWRFAPPLKDRKPVITRARVEVTFKPENKTK